MVNEERGVGEMAGTPRILGVMQPYLFPYLGYFQYIQACSHFIFYDDVQFIMRGWINRNNILLNGLSHLFTVPLLKASPNKTIAQTEVLPDYTYAKMMAMFTQAYKKAPEWSNVRCLLEETFTNGPRTIADLASHSITVICRYLEIDTILIPSSTRFDNAELSRNDRLLDLCQQMRVHNCIVPVGGKELYGKEEFRLQGVELHYLHAGIKPYAQGASNNFVPSLSMLDALMWCNRDEVRRMLMDYYLE